ncbi:MAG TPA: outer membrane protein assembly factor BamB [Steroidobacteraceae bacterium]|nr:outer membrane protein assembly factor BamB [Steroidobacteraceae bacterium]
MRTRFVLLTLALTALIAACSKEKPVDQPRALVPFTPALHVEHVWSASVGGSRKPLRLGLSVAVVDDRVYAAGSGGEVAAFALASGHKQWERKTHAALAGGPGADADLVVVGSSDGEVLALSAADGKVRWRINISGEVLAAPAVNSRIIVVRTVDGKLHGLSPADGHELWQAQEQVPALSLRGTSRPAIVGDVAICGYDDGKVIATNLNDGSSAWQTLIAPPQGTNQIARLNDVDATPHVEGDDVFAVQYQGKVAMLALDTGQIWWAHDMSSYRGMTLDGDDVYVSTADGQVVAIRGRTGAEIWRQKALMYRSLSAPEVSGDAVVVADYKGYVHWLNKATGGLIARTRSSHTRVGNTPVAAGGLVLIFDDRGHISAYRATPAAGA